MTLSVNYCACFGCVLRAHWFWTLEHVELFRILLLDLTLWTRYTSVFCTQIVCNIVQPSKSAKFNHQPSKLGYTPIETLTTHCLDWQGRLKSNHILFKSGSFICAYKTKTPSFGLVTNSAHVRISWKGCIEEMRKWCNVWATRVFSSKIAKRWPKEKDNTVKSSVIGHPWDQA